LVLLTTKLTLVIITLGSSQAGQPGAWPGERNFWI